MKTNSLTLEERFDLVNECRRSGMTDKQWCVENNIHISTFYRWIAKFRKYGFPNLPKSSASGAGAAPVRQEVVKLPVQPEADHDVCSICSSEIAVRQNAPVCDAVTAPFLPVAEICCDEVTIRISNDISPETADMLLSHVRGAL